MADTNDDVPAELIVPNRDQLREMGTRAWMLRSKQANPLAPVKVGPKTLGYVVMSAVADVAMPIFADAIAVARSFLVRRTFGTRLEKRAGEIGIERLPATGATGYMTPTSIVAGGASIQEGDVLIHTPTGLLFTVNASKVYAIGEPIAITASLGGPATNLPADSILTFQNPRAGCSQNGKVTAQNDGSGTLLGLTGGRDIETDVELQDRIIDVQSNPPGSGNSAEIVKAVAETPGVPVQKAWCIPAWYGPGTNSVFFTLRPDTLTGSRIPNSVQRGIVEARLQALFPTDFGITLAAIVEVPVQVAMKVTWKAKAKGWIDPTPWPSGASAFGAVTVSGAIAASSLTARLTSGFVDFPNPVVGQTVGVYVLVTGKFARKRIAGVTVIVPGGTPGTGRTWDLVFDGTNGASDLDIPPAGKLVSPWSDSLNALPIAATNVFKALGPGEQFTTFFDPGWRQKRWPPSPEEWPSLLTGADLIGEAKKTGAVADAVVALPAGIPLSTPVGVPGVFVNLFKLGDFAVYPQ